MSPLFIATAITASSSNEHMLPSSADLPALTSTRKLFWPEDMFIAIGLFLSIWAVSPDGLSINVITVSFTTATVFDFEVAFAFVFEVISFFYLTSWYSSSTPAFFMLTSPFYRSNYLLYELHKLLLSYDQ